MDTADELDDFGDSSGQITVKWVEREIAKMTPHPPGLRDRYRDEMLHCREDAIQFAVLKAIAEDRCPDPKGCAAAALKTEDLDFDRNYN